MTGPLGNSEFCFPRISMFPSNLNVSLDFVSGNIEILGEQNSLFPSGPVIKCLLSTENFQLINSIDHNAGDVHFAET